jgi:uncharacterized protein (UPF0261 family)
MIPKTIGVIGTLDTKGEEIGCLKKQIEKRGFKTTVVDCSILGEPYFTPDFTKQEVARAAGWSIDEVIALAHEGKAIRIMAEGASKITRELYEMGRLDGLAAIGVTMGTSLAAEIMSRMPMLKVPKLVLTNVTTTQLAGLDAAGLCRDIVFMQSVVDIAGLSSILEKVIENAAAAITAMVEANQLREPPARRLVATCAHGVRANKYQFYLKPMLAERGYELISFHATGAGRILEQLTEEGMFAAVLDLNCHEVLCELYGCKVQSAGPDRLEAPGRKGIPHIVAPGSVDYLAWSPGAPISERFRDREAREHNRLVLTLQASREEKTLVGRVIAQKLNKAKGPAAVVFPLRGLSEFDKEGEIYYDPEGDRALLEELKRHLDQRITLVEVDAHINAPKFSQAVVEIFDAMMGI